MFGHGTKTWTTKVSFSVTKKYFQSCRVSDPQWFDADPDPGIWRQKIKNLYIWKKNILSKIAKHLFLGLHKEDAQVTWDAFSPQKRTSSTSKHEFLYFILFLWVIFCPLEPEPDPATQINADQDPKPCNKVPLFLTILIVNNKYKCPPIFENRK
jgi:hypothetical protein